MFHINEVKPASTSATESSRSGRASEGWADSRLPRQSPCMRHRLTARCHVAEAVNALQLPFPHSRRTTIRCGTSRLLRVGHPTRPIRGERLGRAVSTDDNNTLHRGRDSLPTTNAHRPLSIDALASQPPACFFVCQRKTLSVCRCMQTLGHGNNITGKMT